MTIFKIYAEGWRRIGRYFAYNIFLQVLGLPVYLSIYALFYFNGLNSDKAVTFADNPALFSILLIISVLYSPVAFYWASEVTNQFKTKLRKE